jgi:hypothetical protein
VRSCTCCKRHGSDADTNPGRLLGMQLASKACIAPSKLCCCCDLATLPQAGRSPGPIVRDLLAGVDANGGC